MINFPFSYYPFKNKSIATVDTEDYTLHKIELLTESDDRCAYCRVSFEHVSNFIEIDHFVPKDEFKKKIPSLLWDYNNLYISCRWCNNKKRAKYAGDLLENPSLNNLFYRPDAGKYENIFFRSKTGFIHSDDLKGQNMIVHFGWRRITYLLFWYMDRIDLILASGKLSCEDENKIHRIRSIVNKITNYSINRNGKNIEIDSLIL